MAVNKEYQRTRDSYGSMDAIQTLTQASTATAVENHGVTVITSAGSGTAALHAFQMRGPKKGLRKTLVVDPNSTREVVVYANSTDTTFFGGTNNTATFSTGAGTRTVELVGLSTSSWAIVSQTTGVTLSDSTAAPAAIR